MGDYAGNEKSKLLRFVQIAGISGIVLTILSLVLQTISYEPDLSRATAILITFVVFVVISIITLYVTGLLQKITKHRKLVKAIKITYCAIVFCNYSLDLDVHEYMKEEYLLPGFDATDDNPYEKEMMGT